jgi:radical SAM protein with 4Fe4S-binding SPASM domain
LISDPEFVIGKVEGDDILIDSGSKERMSEKTLRERLRGKCAKDSCEYQSSCLGGCRTVAYSMAKLRGEQDPLYAGMDFCRSNMGVVK